MTREDFLSLNMGDAVWAYGAIHEVVAEEGEKRVLRWGPSPFKEAALTPGHFLAPALPPSLTQPPNCDAAVGWGSQAWPNPRQATSAAAATLLAHLQDRLSAVATATRGNYANVS